MSTAAQTRPADVAERIEQVATELVIRNGYHGVSYLGIGKVLGITQSNVHYHYRTKDALAGAVLRRVARDTLRDSEAIWTDSSTPLLRKFLHVRDWMQQSCLRFNPGRAGARPWGLLSHFSIEADALTPAMRKTIRSTLQAIEGGIRTAVRQAVATGELEKQAPIEGVTLQIASVMYPTGQLTRTAAGYIRLDELMMWTPAGVYRAYGKDKAATLKSVPLTPPAASAASAATAARTPASRAGSRAGTRPATGSPCPTNSSRRSA